ncbi:MAG TPA: type II toxin-antitoxin system HicB family antitoxin [Pantanalinema sp.]
MKPYKGYEAVIDFDDDAGLFYGEVLNLRDVVTFQGTTVEELRQAFRESVDDYLEFCAAEGKEPDKPFSGQFLVRTSPDVHRRISTAAQRAGKSLNAWVAENLATVAERTLAETTYRPKRKQEG